MDRKWTLIGGATLITIGTLLILDNLYIIHFDLWDVLNQFWSLALIAIGVWLIYRQIRSHGEGQSTAIAGKISRLAGQVLSKPASFDDRGLDVQLGAGSIDIDLTDVSLNDGVNTVEASVGVGEVVVHLPNDVACDISGSCGLGDVHILAESSDGFSPHLSRTDPGYETASKKIRLIAKSGLGDVRVLRPK